MKNTISCSRAVHAIAGWCLSFNFRGQNPNQPRLPMSIETLSPTRHDCGPIGETEGQEMRMTDTEEPSFDRLVLSRAWFSAWQFFESWRRDIGVFLFSLVVGGGVFWKLHGWPGAWSDAVDVLIHVAAPAVVLWGLLFFWHLWLTPSALAYEAIKSPQFFPATSNRKIPQPNWEIWKKVPNYSFEQFAAILARKNPSAAHTMEGDEYLNLMIADAKAGELFYQVEYGAGVFQDQPFPPNPDSIIPRPVAIKWAEEKQFDVSYIK
jgi:hypothetical protein